ncbi:MAG: hypothetical protein QOH85_1271, partial [Acidobacteriaceae bacterium]|nr:hypothetical protein [Acidobacteriaceae bacterium]
MGISRRALLEVCLIAGLAVTPVVLIGSSTAYAQATASGSIIGNVTDPSGAAIVGAVITATNTGTNA